MKARIGLLVLILALTATMGLGQSDPYRLGWWAQPWSNSFRNASTAGLLEDDLDLMLDPARLPMIQGNRLYTNLSNLVGKDDDVFDNSGNNYYVIGGSGKIMDYGYAGLIYDRYVYRYADSSKTNRTQLTDLDANGTYDVQVVRDTAYYSNDKTMYTDWWIGYGNDLGPGKFGALFYHSVEKVYGEPTQYTGAITTTDLVTGVVTNLVEHSTRRSNDYTYWINGGALSYWYPFSDQIDLGLAGGINLRQNEQIDTIVYSYRQTNPSVPGLNGTTTDSTADGKVVPYDRAGMDICGRLAGIYKWSDQVKTRTDLYFTLMVGGKADDSYRNTTYLNNVSYQLPTGVQSLVTNRSRTGTTGQEDHYANVGLISNTFVTFSEKVEMAIGIGVDSWNRDFTSDYDAAYNETITYNDGISTTFTDYTQVTTGNTKQVHLYTENGLQILTPVCVEFHITKPFVFRLGARHNFQYWGNTDTYHNEITPLVVTYTDAFGVVTQTKPAAYTSYNGESHEHTYNNSWLDYSYGAGWEISKNLQIDLMGFAQLDDMTNWKLSAVFKF